MEGQLPLGVPAVEAVSIHAMWTFPSGWAVQIMARRSGLSWQEGDRRSFDYLTTEELVQVLDDEIPRLFQ